MSSRRKRYFDSFKTFCKDTKIFNRLSKQNICGSLISGGYGMNLLFEQYKIPPSSTTDIDIHLINKTLLRKQRFSNRKIVGLILNAFIIHKHKSLNSKQDYKITHYKLNRKHPLLHIRLYDIYHVSYKGTHIFDFMFTNENYKRIIKKIYFERTGLPLKKARFYAQEVVSSILMENLKFINNAAFQVRNPIIGEQKTKGRKDIARLEKLCRIKKTTPCRLLKTLNLFKKFKDPELFEKAIKNEVKKWKMVDKNTMRIIRSI
jgi:hypothetical protein